MIVGAPYGGVQPGSRGVWEVTCDWHQGACLRSPRPALCAFEQTGCHAAAVPPTCVEGLKPSTRAMADYPPCGNLPRPGEEPCPAPARSPAVRQLERRAGGRGSRPRPNGEREPTVDRQADPRGDPGGGTRRRADQLLRIARKPPDDLAHLLPQFMGRRSPGHHLQPPRLTAPGRQEEWEDSPHDWPQTTQSAWWNPTTPAARTH